MKKNRKFDDVAIIMPVYNEGQVVEQTIATLQQHFPFIVCVDDGSNDNSREQIAKTKAHLVKHPINLGAGAATQTGIEYALGNENVQYFVTFDADGQHAVDDVVTMLDHIKKTRLDIVMGSRFMGKAAIDMPPAKRLILKGGVWFSNLTSGVKLTDTHIGLRVFNRHVAANLNLTLPDFSHASEILERIAEKKFSYGEVPVTVHYSDYSKAKGQSMFNAINIAFDTLMQKVSKK